MHIQSPRQSTTVPNHVVNLVFENGWSPARAWREHLNLTRATIAKRMALPRNVVAQLEAPGIQLHAAACVKLATALGITRQQISW